MVRGWKVGEDWVVCEFYVVLELLVFCFFLNCFVLCFFLVGGWGLIDVLGLWWYVFCGVVWVDYMGVKILYGSF